MKHLKTQPGECTANHSLPLSARLLLWFCREPSTSRSADMTGVHYDLPRALDRLSAVFPDIRRDCRDKHIVDFGCGYGYQAVALVHAGAAKVLGVEVAQHLAAQAIKQAEQHAVSSRVRIVFALPRDYKADIIISQNSFEHFLEPQRTLQELRDALAPGGKIYITFGPPWYAPRGSHMSFFCRLPWIQLFFSERTVMSVRTLYRPDGARTYREAGLAQMSVSKFESTIRQSGLKLVSCKYECIYQLNALQYLPVVRELTINRISCILIDPSGTPESEQR